jgi:restriction system protein
MAVPDFQSVMLPYLQLAGDGKEHSISEMMDFLAHKFELTTEDLEERIPSGRQTRFYNRVTWAGSHLRHAQLVQNTRRSYFKITPRGLEMLASNPGRIDLNVLAQFPEFREFRDRKRPTVAMVDDQIEIVSKTPDELMYESYNDIREALASDILEKVKSCTPNFFENLVVDLLVTMGYGGTLEDAGQAVGKSGDGGIDGIIKEDRLGLDLIYLQAKRWEGTVSRPELQKFAGALLGKQARKGVFITTSSFTNEAREYVRSIGSNIILIDGAELADFMIDYNVGVSVSATYEIKKVDSDFFTDEQ